MTFVLMLFVLNATLEESAPPCVQVTSKQLVVSPCPPGQGCDEVWTWGEPELQAEDVEVPRS